MSCIKSNKYIHILTYNICMHLICAHIMYLNILICFVCEYVNMYSISVSSVALLCPTLCDPMNRSTPGLPVHHQLPEFTQTHVHWVSDAIQPSHPLSSPSPPAPNPSQHQGLFQWVNFSHEVAKVLEFQLQHQSFSINPIYRVHVYIYLFMYKTSIEISKYLNINIIFRI